MESYNERLQNIWHAYEAKHGHVPATTRDAIKWGVREGLISTPTPDPYAKLVEDMSKALREEYATDPKGRRYRRNHAVKITKGGVQHTMWAMMDTAPRQHMQKAFMQRRGQIVDDCVQLSTDVAVYNDMKPEETPIPMLFDFCDDVAERAADDSDKAA